MSWEKLKFSIQRVTLGIKRLVEDTETEALKELGKVLLDKGNSLKVKEAIVDWYSRN